MNKTIKQQNITTTHNKKHRTEDEIYYIQNIGKFSERTTSIPRKDLIRQYFQACLRRTDWGELDKFKILSLLQTEAH